MRASLLIAAVVLSLATLMRGGPPIAAQSPTPPPQALTIPGRATIAPREVVTFRRPADGASLTVSYGRGLAPAMVTYDGAVLTVTVPPLTSNEFLSIRGAMSCVPVTERWNVRCDVQPSGGGLQVLVAVLNAHPPVSLPAPPPGFTLVPLVAGCTNVALTFPDGTAVEVVHDAIHAPAIPMARVEAVWRYDQARQRFLGWSPVSGAPNDFERVNRLDTVFLCMTEAGHLVQPAIP